MTELWPLFARVGAIIAPVILIAAAGYIWAKRDPGFKSQFVGDVALYIGVPPLLFATLIKASVPTDILALSALAAALYIAIVIAVVACGLTLTGKVAGSDITGLSFANWANVAMPICLFTFGETGLAIAAVFFAVSVFLQFTLGWRLAMGAWPWKTIATMPVLWALIAAVLCKSFDITPPKWLLDTATLAGGAAIPCMLLALGGGIARMHPAGLALGSLYALLRAVLGLGVGFVLVTVLPFPAEHKPIILLLSVMPLAVLNYVLAEKTGRNAPQVAGYVVASTGLALVILPVAIAVLMPVY